MKKKTLIIASTISCLIFLISPYLLAADTDKPDSVITDSVKIKPGESAVIAMKIMADDTLPRNEYNWNGIGSLCIPLLYDVGAFKVDSVDYTGAYAKWDEKFINTKIDTGFISFSGIYNLSTGKKPVIFSPDSAETVAHMFITANKTAKIGKYYFELTNDPIQKNAYLGSPSGKDGWRPVFVSGAIEIEK